MFKVKHLGVAAAMILVAAGAMASNFRAADQVYVPAAGHLQGATGTFISDVWVSNLSTTDSVTVSVIYTPTGTTPDKTPQYFDNVITLAPKERKEYIDFFQVILGQSSAFGTLIFNACKTGADCINTQDDFGNSPNYRNIAVFSRIYQIPAGTSLASNPPTTGQAMTGIPWYNFVSSRAADKGLSRVFIQGLRNTGGGGTAGTYRGNIGLMNASQYSTTTIVVRLFNGSPGGGATPTQIGSDYSVVLGPLQHTQPRLEQMFPAFTGATATNGFVTIEQISSTPTTDAPPTCLPDGCPGFLAYGSVLDNVSGDATTLETVYEQALTPEAQGAIYGTTSSGQPRYRHAVSRKH